MQAKYKCKRCGKVVAIKLPNCPECSSCEGYDEVKGLETEKSFRVTIDCNNAAFDGGWRLKHEIARVLRTIADKVTEQLPEDGLERVEKDLNGNTVALWDYV